MKSYKFRGLNFSIDEGVFNPTKTSEILINCICKDIRPDSENLLDLGCGCGIVGSSISIENKIEMIYASDLKKETVENAKSNFERLGIKYEVKAGSLFDPWEGYQFDNIVCDVSGVAEGIANISGWFGEHAPCSSGDDGTKLGIEIISKAPQYLNKRGSFYMAILTLSNHKKLITKLKEIFKEIDIIGEEEYYLEKSITENHAIQINELERKGYIELETKFGMKTWKTIVIKATN